LNVQDEPGMLSYGAELDMLKDGSELGKLKGELDLNDEGEQAQ